MPVDALFDPATARAVALDNLQRGAERADARTEGLRLAIETACELLGIPLEDAHRSFLDRASSPELEALLSHLRAHRSWP